MILSYSLVAKFLNIRYVDIENCFTELPNKEKISILHSKIEMVHAIASDAVDTGFLF